MKNKLNELEKKMLALPDATKGLAIKWTLEQDSAILLYCPKKGVRAVAEVLGVNITTTRARYKYLLGKVGK